MSELTNPHENYSLASKARDIILHFAEAKEEGGASARKTWQGFDTNDTLWNVTLQGEGLYGSSSYTIDLRSETSSEWHRYTYDDTHKEYIYECPVGNMVSDSQENIRMLMTSWLETYPTPDAITYDAEGIEYGRQVAFSKLSARVAIDDVLRGSPFGQDLFDKLSRTKDPQVSKDLHRQFYELTRQSTLSFHAGSFSTYHELEAMLQEQKSWQCPDVARENQSNS